MKTRIVGLLLLLFIAFLFFTKNDDVRELVEVADQTADLIHSDIDMYRAESVLGGDAVLYERLLADYPDGSPVCIPYSPTHPGSVHRFKVALLPEFTLSSKAELVLYTHDKIEPNDEVIERGHAFVLLKRVKDMEAAE